MEKLMKLEDCFGRTITNIYELLEMEVYGNDTGECFIELDNTFIIDIPFGFVDDIWVKELNKDAQSLFVDLSDYPVYSINKEGKSIGEITENYQKEKKLFFNRLRKFLFGIDVVMKAYQPYKVEYRENKLKYIKNRIISDYVWYEEDCDKGFFLLDNGYLITETILAFHGTGLAGLNYYESIEALVERRGKNYKKLSDGSVL